MGEDTKATFLYRTHINEILARDMADNVYMDWADLAYNQGQVLESIRRIEIILPLIKNPYRQFNMQVARAMRKLELEADGSIGLSRKLIKEISESEKLTQAQKDKLERVIYENLLEYGFKKALPEVEKLVLEVNNRFLGEEWVEYWLLKRLIGKFKNTNLEDLKLDLDETIKALGQNQKGSNKFLNKQKEVINSIIENEKYKQRLRKRGLLK